jgi:aspartokinase
MSEERKTETNLLVEMIKKVDNKMDKMFGFLDTEKEHRIKNVYRIETLEENAKELKKKIEDHLQDENKAAVKSAGDSMRVKIMWSIFGGIGFGGLSLLFWVIKLLIQKG